MCAERLSPSGLMVPVVSVKFGMIHPKLSKVSNVKMKTYWTPLKKNYISQLLVLLHLYHESFLSLYHFGANVLQVEAEPEVSC